jgi:Predicted hydrolases or acyltransferases (alpha/beta hydrolase superfamily)
VTSLQVNGHAVHAEVSGDGPPALFLHGVPDSAEVWRPVIAGLTDRYRCHAADFMGLHRSQFDPGFDYRLDGLADWVEGLVAALAITEPLTLVAHDWGGVMGLAWACKYPQRVRRIVVMGAPFSPDYRPHRWARIWGTPGLGELAMLGLNRRMFQRELRRGGPGLTQAQLDATWQATPSRCRSRRVILRLYRSGSVQAFAPWQAALGRLAARVPITALWGSATPTCRWRWRIT